METDNATNPKEYEIAVLVKNEADLAALSMLLKEHKAELTGEPKAKNIVLAYEIKGHKEAVFAYALFKALPEDAKNLERDLVSKEEIIRSLIIASPAPAEKPMSAMPPMRERKARPPRAGVGSETKATPPQPLSNEALEKKIEEILQ